VPVWLLIAVVALVVIVLAAVALVMARSHPNEGAARDGRRPEGYWTSLGISIGAGFGLPLGLVFDNLALGIAMGAGFGVAIGAALERTHRDEVRPLTSQELQTRKRAVGLGLAFLALGVAVFAASVLIRGR
jgi:hypothetical protein